MRTAIRTKATTRRKLIDIPDDVFRTLSVKAAAMGLNLKNYIEKLLAEDANEIDDAEIYAICLQRALKGKQCLMLTKNRTLKTGLTANANESRILKRFRKIGQKAVWQSSALDYKHD